MFKLSLVLVTYFFLVLFGVVEAQRKYAKNLSDGEPGNGVYLAQWWYPGKERFICAPKTPGGHLELCGNQEHNKHSPTKWKFHRTNDTLFTLTDVKTNDGIVYNPVDGSVPTTHHHKACDFKAVAFRIGVKGGGEWDYKIVAAKNETLSLRFDTNDNKFKLKNMHDNSRNLEYVVVRFVVA